MKIISILLFTLLISSCSGYSKFYKPYVDAKKLKDVELLKPNEVPKIQYTNDLGADRRKLVSKGYGAIGYASFNGKLESERAIIEQAKSVSATLILVTSEYTGTQTVTSNLYLPDNKTTYHSGTSYGNTSYSNPYGYLGNSSTRLNYSGTSTTYGTKVVPITKQHRRYNQTAMFFVKSTKKLKFGVHLRELTDEQKVKLERNTGANVYTVVEDTPAFYANVLQDDILLKINNTDIKSPKHASNVMRDIPTKDVTATYTVLRKGKEKVITIKFIN